MMMTCRLLCALLVLALCCCPSVCVTGSADRTILPPPLRPQRRRPQRLPPRLPLRRQQLQPTTTTTTTTHTNCDHTTTTQAPLRPPLPRRRQALRLQRRQLRGPPAHRHFFAKLTAVPAALRGFMPRWCSRCPCWLTAVCA
ncbi:putative mucin TcMUCI, partial [Trypanosoma cruzi]